MAGWWRLLVNAEQSPDPVVVPCNVAADQLVLQLVLLVLQLVAADQLVLLVFQLVAADQLVLQQCSLHSRLTSRGTFPHNLSHHEKPKLDPILCHLPGDP